MFSCKPDYEMAQRRMDAFWANDMVERPLVNIVFDKPGADRRERPAYPSHMDYWLDIDYRAEEASRNMENQVFYADAMPVVFPNLGPEILSAWAGCRYHFGATTAWSEPCIFDWEKDSEKAVIDTDHFLFQKLVDYTNLLIERGKGKFIVGLSDFHPGGDHLAALRDPANLNIDLIENPELVKAKLASSYQEYFKVFDFFCNMLKSAGMPISTWTPLTAMDRMYVPSNDFSCMISTKMFEEFFLPGIADECRFYGKSIYHLDGPNALRHLDLLLEIKELNAVQWVPGAGHEDVSQWIPVYQKVLAAGKSVQIMHVRPADLDILMENLPAKGIWLCMRDVKDEYTAQEVMKKISRWK